MDEITGRNGGTNNFSTSILFSTTFLYFPIRLTNYEEKGVIPLH